MKEDIYNKRIVKIILPLALKESNSLTIPSMRTCHFSGYVIGDGIIITCRHAFVDKGLWDKSRPIEIKYQQKKLQEISLDEATTLQALKDNNTILFESEKYDIVLLAANKLEATFNGIYLREWDKPDSWEGGGYPKYNNDELKLLDGKASSAIKGKQNLELEPRQKPHEMESWKEISGGPVFVQCDSHCQLVGIILDYDPKLTNELKASYLKRLWDEDDEFQEIIKQKYYQGSVSTFCKDELQRLLVEDDLKRKVVTTFGLEKESELATALLNINKQEFMDQCLNLANNEIKNIDALVIVVLRYHYTNMGMFKHPDLECQNVAFQGDVPCEFAMAGEDNSEPSLFFDESLNSVEVTATHRLDKPPGGGIFDNSSKDIAIDINNRNANIATVTKRLAQDHQYYGNEFEKLEDEEELEAANGVLEISSRSYYWKLHVSTYHEKLLKDIAEAFPTIKVLNMEKKGRIKTSNQEIRDLKNLASIIKATQKHD